MFLRSESKMRENINVVIKKFDSCDLSYKRLTDNIAYRHSFYHQSTCHNDTNIAVRLKGQSYQEATSELYRNCASYHDHQQFFLFVN